MDIKEVERIVGGIQAKLFSNSNSLSIGILKSKFRGTGLQFKEHQIYVPGDEVRFIDWKLFAKSSIPYVKTFEEERNIEIDIIIDWSSSLLMGEFGRSKLQVALEITALLYLLSKKTNDKVSFILATDELHRLPPKSGKEGLVDLIALLEKMNILNKNGTVNLDRRLAVMKRRDFIINVKSMMAKKKEVIYLGDFANFDDLNQLSTLVDRHNFHCFRLITSLEKGLPEGYYLKTDRGKYIKTQDVELNNYKEKGRWKEIEIGKKYLELFVKEMI